MINRDKRPYICHQMVQEPIPFEELFREYSFVTIQSMINEHMCLIELTFPERDELRSNVPDIMLIPNWGSNWISQQPLKLYTPEEYAQMAIERKRVLTEELECPEDIAHKRIEIEISLLKGRVTKHFGLTV